MLGKTASGVFWMYRYLERGENIARLIDAGFRVALTQTTAGEEDWGLILDCAGVRDTYCAHHDHVDGLKAANFLLRDRNSQLSVLSMIETARNNARVARTALTQEVWEAINQSWIDLKEALSRPVRVKDLPGVLAMIRQQNALVRGAMHGSMLRNDIFNFARLGTYVERADATARILNVRYYALLPSSPMVGSGLENAQWETILRSAGCERSFRAVFGPETAPHPIVEFLVLDQRMPRSLAFCYGNIVANLGHLAEDYGHRSHCHGLADAVRAWLGGLSARVILDEQGLEPVMRDFIQRNNTVGAQIEADYRFTG